MPQIKDLVPIAMREGVAFSKTERRKPVGISEAEQGIPSSFALDLHTYQLFTPLYHFNALAVSNILPRNGVFVHFGVDAAQFLIYLAQRRPDVHIIALEPKYESLEQQWTAVTAAGLTDRLQLVYCEVGKVAEVTPEVADLFASTMTLHLLANEAEMGQLLHQAALLRIRCGTGLWFFDYARPKLARSVDDLVQHSYPGSSGPLRIRERSALHSAFAFTEVAAAMETLNLGKIESALSKPVGYLQAHWIDPTGAGVYGGHANWNPERLPPSAQKEFVAISQMFPAKILPPNSK